MSIEEQIIQASIIEGGKNSANLFSTKQIAETCGINEARIYEIFQSKESLLEQTDLYLATHWRDAVVKAAEKNTDFQVFFSEIIDYQMSNRYWNGFSLNYGHLSPRYSVDRLSEAYRERMTVTASLVLPHFFPNVPKENLLDLYRFFMREMIAFTQLLLSHQIPDTPVSRSIEANLLLNGLNAYRQTKK
jgi:AcrR family transcriptional regulator